MLSNKSTSGRVVFTALFAATCITFGFLLATGFETPSKSIAQSSINAPLPLVGEDGSSPFVAVAERVKPVVVNISAEREVSNHPSVPDLFDWGPFFREPRRQPRIPRVTSGGSGIIISEDGYILTNNHVISEANKIVVKFADGTEHPAEIIGADPETDVALIKVNSSIPASMVAKIGDSDLIRIGEWAIAVGNPFGLDWTLTVGVISASGRSNLNIGGGGGPSYQNFIQTDASINFGNSGGPLLNIKGEVIGVNTAINAQGQGIGFAIPINLARRVVDQLMTSGEVKRGYLGVIPTELDELKREALGIDPEVEGVFMDNVQPNTPAQEGGLKGGEVVIAIDGQKVKNVTEFRFKIADYPPGSKVKMTIWKDGKTKELTFKLGDRSEYLSLASNQTERRSNSWLGIEVTSTKGNAGERFQVTDLKGALVVGIEPNSPAQGLLQMGDVIVEVGGYEVESPEDFRKASESLKDRKKAIPFWVMRDGRRTFVPIRPE